MSFDGLDPDALRDLGDRSGDLASVAETSATAVGAILAECALDSHAPRTIGEIGEEMRLLAGLCSLKATQMELASFGMHFLDGSVSAALAALLVSLNDSDGDHGLVGDNALGTLALGFAYLDADRDGVVTPAELQAAADDRSLPDEIRLAAGYLLDNEGLAANAANVSQVQQWWSDDYGQLPYGAITMSGLQTLLEQNHVLRLLADPGTFRELESAGDGGNHDGRLSMNDLEAILESSAASAAARDVARYLLDHPSSFGWFDQGSRSPDGMIGLMLDVDGIITMDDVIALTVGQHAFAADPAGAREWTLSLASYATWMDVSGKTSGIDIRLSTDDGLRALAAAALSDTSSLAEQVAVVSSMPESPGGVRNQLITFYYAELAGQMNERMNLGLDAADPKAFGHTGANWMQFAPWASNSVGPALRGEITAYLQHPSWADRQYAADGNQYIFGDVAVRYAAFLEAFPPGAPIDAAAIEQFFEQDHPFVQRPLFGEGHGQLRDSFAYYLAAIEESDPEMRQRLTMQGNLLIATHEQAGAQHALAGIVDLDVGDDGWFRGVVGEVGGWVLEGSDEKVATNRMQLLVGFGDEQQVVHMSDDLAETLSPGNNRVLDESLSGSLNPDQQSSVDIGGLRVGLGGGGGDVSLADIGGWDEPPAGTDMDRFPTDPAEWEREAGFELSDNDRELMEHLGQDPDDLPSTYGTDTTNWADPNQRQWFISNMFQQMHTDPVLFDGLGDLAIGSDWADDLSYLPDNVVSTTR